MSYYEIKWQSEIQSAKERYEVRKANLKITQFCHVVTGVEIDPLYIDCTYHIQSSILIWLN